MPIIPFAEYAPDMPRIAAPYSDVVCNVLPRTAASYEPWRSAVVVANPITARAQGTATFQDTAGAVRLFAGDATKLYRLASGSTFSDVSKGGGYTTAASERWSFTVFGSRIIASNYGNVVQSYVDGVSTLFADLVSSGITTIKARYAATVKNFLVLGNTSDATYGVNPQRVWWSAIEDPTNFPTPGTSGAAAVQSDYQDVVGPHGWCQGIVGNLGNADAALFFERAVYRMTYVGPPAVFDIRAAEGTVGCPAPGSIIQFRSTVFYLGEDGFYQFDGSTSRPIGKHKIDRFFFNEVDQKRLGRVNASVDPTKPIVYWAYPTGTSGECNRVLAYNWSLDRWTVTEVDAITVQVLFRSLTLGEHADSIDDLFANSDLADVPVDSREFMGGRLVMSGFDASNRLVFFNGDTLAACIETQEANIIDGQHALVTQIRPIVDGGTPSVAIGARDLPSASVSYGSAVPIGPTGISAVRSRGRYLRAQVTMPAGAQWEHASGLEIVKAAPVGSR